ncbi:MAG: ring-cleaving dioxygenase, partial [Mesorhizobium sp.]
EVDKSGNIRRLAIKNGNGADVVDIESLPGAGFANLGAGSVHHVAFAVEDRAKQLEVRKALIDTGYGVT